MRAVLIGIGAAVLVVGLGFFGLVMLVDGTTHTPQEIRIEVTDELGG
jgi:hypothetical protein